MSEYEKNDELTVADDAYYFEYEDLALGDLTHPRWQREYAGARKAFIKRCGRWDPMLAQTIDVIEWAPGTPNTNGIYEVADGWGRREIGLTDPDMGPDARVTCRVHHNVRDNYQGLWIFTQLNKQRQTVTAAQLFLSGLGEGLLEENIISNVLKEYGLRVTLTAGNGKVTGVGKLREAFARGSGKFLPEQKTWANDLAQELEPGTTGSATLRETLYVMTTGFHGEDRTVAQVMGAVNWVLSRCASVKGLKVDLDRLAAALEYHGKAKFLVGQCKIMDGNSASKVGRLIVQTYNGTTKKYSVLDGESVGPPEGYDKVTRNSTRTGYIPDNKGALKRTTFYRGAAPASQK